MEGGTMFRFTIRKLLVVVLMLCSPGFAWGRSEHHAYRELERVRQQWKQEAKQLDKLRRGRTFQLDVF
jgi:hypothetical protein